MVGTEDRVQCAGCGKWFDADDLTELGADRYCADCADLLQPPSRPLPRACTWTRKA